MLRKERNTVRQDARLLAMADAIAAYEARFGLITPEEIVAQQRADRARAVVVNGQPMRRTRRDHRRK